MFRGLKQLSYKNCLKGSELWLFGLEKKRLQVNLIAAFQH